MAGFSEQTDLVVNIIRDRRNEADDQLAITRGMIESARQAIEDAVVNLTNNSININTAGVDTTYSAPTATAPSIPAAPALPTVPDIPNAPIISSAPALPTTPVLPTAPTAGSAPALPTSPALPTDPTIPAASGIAISDTDWDAAYLRALGLQSRIEVKNTALAANRAAFAGHAEWAETQAALLAEAQDGGDEEASKNALASALDQSRALREDVIALLGPTLEAYRLKAVQEIDNFKALASEARERYVAESSSESLIYEATGRQLLSLFSTTASEARERYTAEVNAQVQVYLKTGQLETEVFSVLARETRELYVSEWSLALDKYKNQWATKTASEQARLGFEKLELDKVTHPERVRAEYDLKKTEIANQNAVGELVDLVQVYAQLTNGLFQSSDVGLSSSAGMSLSEGRTIRMEAECVDSASYPCGPII